MKAFMYVAYSKDHTPLYVGITEALEQRLASHRNGKAWWADVDHLTIREYSSRVDAEAAERKAISELQPEHNELRGVKLYPARRLQDRKRPKTYASLPLAEAEYLKTLSSDETYARCAELQRAGWSIASMLEVIKVAPTLTQLNSELKYRQLIPVPTGVPVPEPPKSRAELLKESAAEYEKNNYLSDEEKELLKEYAGLAKKYRPQYGMGHPIYEAAEEYKVFITELHDRGVLFSTIAKVVGVNESNIRRRYTPSK